MSGYWFSVRDRRRNQGASDDSGFMLIYVLMVISIVTVLVGSVLLVTGNSLIPAVQTSYNQAANSAALGGINAFVAYADANCSGQNSAVSNCALPTNYSGTQTIYSGSGYTSTYSWVAQKDPQGRYFRVTSTGTTTQGGMTGKRIVTADVAGGASMNILDYGVVTGYETQSSASVLALFPQRTVAIDATAAALASGPIKGGQINWSGSSPGTAAGKVAVCNATFAGSHGRADLPPPKAPNPYVDWSESALNGNKFTNFQPCQVSFSSMTKLLAATNPADGVGGYYSADALLLSNSYPGGTGPTFNQPVTTGFQYSQLDNPPCGTAPGQNYRAFDLTCAGYSVDVGGTPSPSSVYPPPQYVSTGPVIPTSTPQIPSTACVYNGPTRVKLNSDGTAVVTSPQTTSDWVTANAAARPAQCYLGAGPAGVGMAAATISLVAPSTIRVMAAQTDGTAPPTTPALAHGSSGWNTTGQVHGNTSNTSNSVFYLTSGTAGSNTITAYVVAGADKPYTPVVGDNPSTKTDGSWTPQWSSFSSGSSCTTSTSVADLKFFNCYVNSGAYDASAYPKLKASVQTAVSTTPSSYATAANLTSLVNNLVKVGNSADGANANPTNATNASHKWNVSTVQDASTTDGCHPSAAAVGSTTNTPISAPSSDPFFANSGGNSASTPTTTTTCYTTTVSAQVGTCNVALVLGVCVNLGNYVWGNGTALLGGGQSVPQFKVTFTVTQTDTTVTVTPSVSAFPNTDDVTQYAMGTNGTYGNNGPGDLYIEGTAANTMAFAADNDVIVTGTLTAANPTTQAIETVAQNDLRIYHPVKCVVTDPTMIATTTPGFCPDDLTGLYNTVLPNGSRPDQQYTNMRTDLAGLTLNGAFFALGNAPIKFTCPAQPSTTAVCGGEFTVDNYNRGDSAAGGSLGYLTLNGTVAMAHHSPLGEEWEIPDTPGQSSRPYSGYQFASRYQNLKQALTAVQDVSGVLHTVTTTSSLWHIVSSSTASGS